MPDVKTLLAAMHNPTAEDKALVEKAYSFAQEAHKDHQRMSGEPYFIHLYATAKSLAELGMGAKTVAAGLLHDSVEDVGIEPETIEREFGPDVRFMVEGVTKLGHYKFHGSERHRESLRKLLIATSKDIRVLIIKLMDRMHNMQTLDHVPQEKRDRIARETLEIYAAIAHRLGMGLVRRDLEDLAFRYAYPTEYEATRKLAEETVHQALSFIDPMRKKLETELAAAHLQHFHVDHRVKGLYSLWCKMKRHKGDLAGIYDIAAIRVIVPSVEDCYRALGVVHHVWQPLPNRIKDYIAFPKPNGYQSLHTTVFSGDGGVVEIQIRTEKMHHEAEFGIASHVAYKEKPVGGARKPSSFDWIKSLVPSYRREMLASEEEQDRDAQMPIQQHWIESLGDNAESPEFENAVETDLFSHRIFVFTPKGDVIDLPADATPIDFAYTIHSDIGHHIAGAKVNGKMISLDKTLQNGDIVEIETRKNAKPSTKWLDFVRTSEARRHIRNYLASQGKGEN